MNTIKFILCLCWLSFASIIIAQDCSNFTLSGTTGAVSCNGATDGSINLNLPCTPGIGGSGANLALNATVAQSSTQGDAVATRAIDDNTSGVWYVDFSVASTQWEFSPYYTMDLGEVANIDEIEIWGRTDCCQSFLSNYYIFLSDTPFASDDLMTTINDTNVNSFNEPGPAGAPNTTTIGTSGRYIRIQLGNPGLLQMSEIVVREASGGACDLTINWDNGIGDIENPTNLGAGTYGVTVSNTDGCTATKNFTIVEPIALNVDVTETTNAENSTLTAAAEGGTPLYQYRWSNGATSASINVTGGNFSVTTTDANGCTATDSYSLTCTTGANCNDGNDCTINDVFDANCDCVGTFQDSDNDGVCDMDDICPGFDDTQDSDDDGIPDGCDSPDCDGFTLNGNVTDVSCKDGNDGQINLSLPCVGGGGETNLALNRPATQSATLSNGSADLAVDGNTSGAWYIDYSVASTTWASNSWWEVDLGAVYDISEIEVWGRTDCCQAFLTNYYLLVSEDPFLSTDLNTTLGQSGVADFLESGSAGAPNTRAINTMGRYVRIQLQGSGLLQLAEVVVKGSGNTANCDLTINWDNNLGNIEDPTNLGAGIYNVTVSNTDGCTATKSFTISEPNTALSGTASVIQEITNNNGNDGRITVAATGGASPYSYLWNNGITSANVNNLSAGLYTVVITDANACTFSASVTLENPGSKCNITCNVTEENPISSVGGGDGSAKASHENGTAPYSYLWNNNATSQTIDNLSAGTYSVTITDDEGCTCTSSVTLTDPVDTCNITCEAQVSNAISITGGNDGSVTVSRTGGIAPYTYVWSNNENSQTISGLSAGIYTVTITDAEDCTCTSSVTLVEPGESVLTMDCPEDISLFATSSNGARVHWELPETSTTCSIGGGDNCSENISGFTFVGEYNGSKYYTSNYRTYWAKAKEDCEDKGGHLAIIEDQAENTYVKELISQAHFIGLTDEQLEGTYKWVNGTGTTFSMFGSYQPNTATKDYVILNHWGNGTWSHATGTVYKVFIMEKPCSNNGINLTQTAGLSSGATFPVGTTNVSYRAEDNCGNIENCSFTVTVQEPNSSISLSCPNNITVMQTAPDGADVNWNEPTAGTTCGTSNTVTFTQTGGNPSGSRFSVGTTTISYRAQDECGSVSNCSFTITVTPDNSATLPSGYCDARGEQPWFEWITGFEMGTINNVDNNNKEGRGNFTLQSTNVTSGGTYPFTITPEFSWIIYDEYFRIWIDLNRDADFEDEGEMLFEGTSNEAISGSINIPNDVTNGATMLRIAMNRGGYAEPCDEFVFGEVEDYTVVIGGSNPSPLLVNTGTGELLRLEADKKERQVELSWLNNTGPVNDTYTIERSANGRDYEALFSQDAYNALGRVQYLKAYDEAPLAGDNFYRIKLIFDDGTIKYSDYRYVHHQPITPFSIYPNPAQEQAAIDLVEFNGEEIQILITNQYGQVIETITTTDSIYDLNLKTYTNGVYLVYLKSEKRRSVPQKMLVTKMY